MLSEYHLDFQLLAGFRAGQTIVRHPALQLRIVEQSSSEFQLLSQLHFNLCHGNHWNKLSMISNKWIFFNWIQPIEM